MQNDTLHRILHRRTPRGTTRLAAAAAIAVLSLRAQAAPVTLHIQGSFTATNSAATLNSAAAKALAASVNGTSSWNTLANIPLSFELDLDDTLTRTQLAVNNWNWFMGGITELRISLGNAHFSTRGTGSDSLGSILVGATDTDNAPAPALSTGMLLRLGQPWTRNTAVTPVPYSFAGATPQVSGDGLYEHFFRTAYDAGEGNRTLDFWGTLASTDALTGGLPTGRWRLTDFEVTAQAGSPAASVPEPSTASLLVLALAVSMVLGGRRR